MRRPSLARRLLGTSLLALVMVLGVGGAALSYAFRRSAETAFDVRLRAWSDALVSSLAVDGQGVVLERPLGDPRFQRAFSGWYWVVGADRAPLLASASLWDAELRVQNALRKEAGTIHVHRAMGPRDQELRAFVQEITLPGLEVPLRVVLAGDVAELQRETERFDALLWTSLAVLGGALLALVAVQMRLTLRPLRALAESLGDVRQGHRDRVDPDAPQELAPLVDAVNDLLAHDAALVERARTQAADLAHALKTPLSLVMAEASELTDDRGRRIISHAETMRRHIDRRLGGASPRPAVAGERTPLHPVVDGIVQTLARLHPTREIELDAPTELAFPGPREDLEEIAGNLLENACKWARHRVLFRARETDRQLELSVDDDGPGLEPAQREQVLARGARLDVQAPGAGLGLGIVCDVAATYRGSLRLDRSELGGLIAVVTLPRSC
jgi:signal transduction histidine kinase